MLVGFPEKLQDLVERPIVAALATIMPSGAPQVTPVWFMHDGTHIIINTARGRQKDRNMQPGSKVTLSVIDPQNPYHWAELRGTIESETEEGAFEVIKDLALKYRGKREYPQNPGEVRVTYKIALDKVNGS
jgi:PPOX class probable F420-dependent enzyme